ncbi:hypothetical protein B0S90_0274 [Caldicellulosiruptor bescii]|uniref:Uncharacterized protein n=3 Tax=Caldicellulosiruptor TaxID=44000 RepID=B9ML49_CALBD|nr:MULTISPECIES: hypothetical protein [Caldicellulosiruptor]ACM59180.1 hypothetical protein Athe_0014 [Caldicellulosiruptor bescii DSM 6725]ADQ39614.1 hypothetical protein Calkr_0028 [Caldicellulosiruptor acetigenus I77R1B]PBC88368.1 hypothetical protein B0S87_1351 [Caldicellulosiruptor bescii]PBC92151.1 hypothetical protein B0S89_2642 [Caldicellulosiruptor bescii]PBD05039.1 hypothetical protein B0S85_2764 [Caldicellulosiruptor bescii]
MSKILVKGVKNPIYNRLRIKSYLVSFKVLIVVVTIIIAFLLINYATDWVNRIGLDVDEKTRSFINTLAFSLSLDILSPCSIDDTILGYPITEAIFTPIIYMVTWFKGDSKEKIEYFSRNKSVIELLLSKLQYVLMDNSPEENFMNWVKSKDIDLKKYEKEDILTFYWAFHFLDVNVIVVIFSTVVLIGCIGAPVSVLVFTLIFSISTLIEDIRDLVFKRREAILRGEEGIEDEDERKIYEKIKEEIKIAIYKEEEARNQS